MKIDVTQKLLDLDGEAVLIDQDVVLDAEGNIKIKAGRPEMSGGKPLTFALAAVNSLMGTFEDEKTLEGSKKLDRFELACKIKAAALPIELSPTEMELIKTLVGKMYLGPLIYARMVEMLEAAKAYKPKPVKQAAE